MQLGWRHAKRCLLNLKNKRKQATTERNRGTETGASNSKMSSHPHRH